MTDLGMGSRGYIGYKLIWLAKDFNKNMRQFGVAHEI